MDRLISHQSKWRLSISHFSSNTSQTNGKQLGGLSRFVVYFSSFLLCPSLTHALCVESVNPPLKDFSFYLAIKSGRWIGSPFLSLANFIWSSSSLCSSRFNGFASSRDQMFWLFGVGQLNGLVVADCQFLTKMLASGLALPFGTSSVLIGCSSSLLKKSPIYVVSWQRPTTTTTKLVGTINLFVFLWCFPFFLVAGLFSIWFHSFSCEVFFFCWSSVETTQ